MSQYLLLSAYDAPSHQSWRKGLVQWVEGDWTVWTLPARHYSWRMRGNPLTWYEPLQKLLREQRFDAVVCTSMVDLSTLRGLCPKLTAIPTLVYFHENQAAYPRRAGGVDAADVITNAYTALAADRVAFNSEYNRTSFLEGMEVLFRRLPDGVPTGIVQAIREKSRVLPVGITPIENEGSPKALSEPLRLVWNHRWEYDKAPKRLFLALASLADHGVAFRVDVLGHRFRNSPSIFDTAKEDWAHCIGRWGYVERREYELALKEADVVLSTALHEFQGLAVLEAMSAACIPIVPDRLAYRETVPDTYRYSSYVDDEEAESTALVETLLRVIERPNPLVGIADYVKPFHWANLAPGYAQVLDELVS